MPDYTVLVRVRVTASSALEAARSAQCYLFDFMDDQVAVVQDEGGQIVGKFPFADLDRWHEDEEYLNLENA